MYQLNVSSEATSELECMHAGGEVFEKTDCDFYMPNNIGAHFQVIIFASVPADVPARCANRTHPGAESRYLKRPKEP